MENEIGRIRLSENCLNGQLVAEALLLRGGVHVSVYGGDLPHIGAVSIADAAGEVSTIQFPGHRDAAVSERWARAISGQGVRPAVVEAGIHYDAITEEGIRAVLRASESMLSRLLQRMRQEENAGTE